MVWYSKGGKTDGQCIRGQTDLLGGVGIRMRFLIQPENEDELVGIAQKHMKEVHGKDFTEDELRRALEEV